MFACIVVKINKIKHINQLESRCVRCMVGDAPAFGAPRCGPSAATSAAHHQAGSCCALFLSEFYLKVLIINKKGQSPSLFTKYRWPQKHKHVSLHHSLHPLCTTWRGLVIMPRRWMPPPGLPPSGRPEQGKRVIIQYKDNVILNDCLLQ